ncbi:MULTISPECIES: hypothetical protein [Thiorhodovibrio]|uniref:hypothetical protein n=1 Tax=Thiorhodovibrio TaxID=61593 RepID=UPI00191140F8|nr:MULTISPECIES: hypothetical protein [Thiorhodovibrio]MBK5969035.1 hypothetical protein [Thiorhodovibrio winogradskyi]WPL15084.1 hypothetical protein Thiosp_04948 [Thiorhodovibrio litoralis]
MGQTMYCVRATAGFKDRVAALCQPGETQAQLLERLISAAEAPSPVVPLPGWGWPGSGGSRVSHGLVPPAVCLRVRFLARANPPPSCAALAAAVGLPERTVREILGAD